MTKIDSNGTDAENIAGGDGLNLPWRGLQLRHNASGVAEVFDPQRSQWLVLTPEEWVRQRFTAWLREDMGYPRSLIANEVGLRLNGQLRRCDTLVYDSSLHPLAVVEYKAPTVAITQRVFDQIARYNIVVQARVLIVSNGLHHYCCRYTGDGYEFLREVPVYDDLCRM